MAKITLATLHTATAQQVFDQVRDHLLRQGRRSDLPRRSPSVGNQCLYRGPDGLKCAAGCLIDDAEYDPSIESGAWGELARNSRVPRAHNNLIRSLQVIHDSYAPAQWEKELRLEAIGRGLAWTITLATLPTASAQEVFEQAAKHLLKQGKRAMGLYGCQYRTNDGLACAAGALLSEDDATRVRAEGVNGASWSYLIHDLGVTEKHSSLIAQLQSIHDSMAHGPESWPSLLLRLAREHGLDDSFLTPATPCEPISIPETAQA